MRRRVHLGLDYGTSAAKLVVRDYGAPGGGDPAYVVPYRGRGFRFPSGVAVSDGYLWFGQGPEDLVSLGLAPAATLYESVKMRCAVEMDPTAARLHLDRMPAPAGLRWADLATLTVWWLISQGYRYAQRLIRPTDELAFRPTMGAPTSFLQNPKLRAGFLEIIRGAWTILRARGPLRYPFFPVPSAHKEIERARAALAAASGDQQSREDERDWLRSEAEGALWWAFQSPNVQAGPFLKVDVGAGTTNVSLFRIVDDSVDGRPVKSRICFFSAVSGTEGMDAIDRALGEAFQAEPTAFRGMEAEICKTHPAQFTCCDAALESIGRTIGAAWGAARDRIGIQGAERDAWNRDCRVLLLGGGAQLPPIQSRATYNGATLSIRPVQVLERPTDLLVDGRIVSRDELRFLLSAYGLSVLGLAIPEVGEADPLGPAERALQRRRRLEWDDAYAK